ncbi:hypothetical protein CA237_03580 [Sphingomonas sp. ABOLH]|nr:hypothetical protein CA237_03580 [Sphingomonas sp. ABOLH]
MRVTAFVMPVLWGGAPVPKNRFGRCQPKENDDGQGCRYRSACIGHYVSGSQGCANPSTAVREAPGTSGTSGARYRSAISGCYVTTKHGKASPGTTVCEK